MLNVTVMILTRIRVIVDAATVMIVHKAYMCTLISYSSICLG